MEIRTRRRRPHISEIRVEQKEEEEQPLSPAARLFQAPEFNCNIISVVGLKSKIKPDVIIEGIKQTLIRHPRFSCKLVKTGNSKRQEQKWVQTNVVAEDHVVIPKIDMHNRENANAFLDSYVSDLTTIPLDMSKPLWEVHLLDLRTSEAENVAILKIHHSVGDGMSLMSLVLACTRKTSNPDELLSLPNQKRLLSGSKSYSRLLWLVRALWSVVMLVLNTFYDALEFIATAIFLKDTETPIKGNFQLSTSKRMCCVHRTVSFDDLKLIKNAMQMTVNDVVLGVSQAGLSQYLKRRYGEQEEPMPKGIRLRAALLVNIRPATGLQDLADIMAKGSKCTWGNWIGYIIFPFSIAFCDDPLEHLRRAKSIIDRKKNSFEALLTFIVGNFILKSFGVQSAANILKRALSNTTMSFSNLVGPIEEISFYGHPVTYMAPSVYGHPHALTMHFQSYMNKMTVSLTVDPTVISDPHRLCDDWEESLRSIKAAVQEKSCTQ